jgi:hypothetical protein
MCFQSIKALDWKHSLQQNHDFYPSIIATKLIIESKLLNWNLNEKVKFFH